MSNLAKIISGIVVMVLISVGAYFGLTHKSNTAQVSIPSDWKTYRDDTYGFEMKLPRNWTTKDIGGALLFGTNPTTQDFDMMFTGPHSAAEGFGISGLRSSVIYAGNTQITKHELPVNDLRNPGREYIDYQIENGNQKLHFQTLYPSKESILLQIFSTFKFIR